MTWWLGYLAGIGTLPLVGLLWFVLWAITYERKRARLEDARRERDAAVRRDRDRSIAA